MSEHFEISERLAKILHRTVLSVLGLAAILAVITMNLMLLPLRHPEVPVWFWIIFLALLFLAGAVVVIVVLALYSRRRSLALTANTTTTGAVFAFNLLFGWTILGWIAALVWGMTAKPCKNRGPCPMCAEP
jgi:Superinfection immunity protein